jgi:hypothetical protein
VEKFGLDSLKTQKMNALELEVAKEKATSLGIAGKRLQSSIVEYAQSISRDDISEDERERLLDALVANINALIVQRELVGLIHDNMQWVLRTYDIPQPALAKLGVARS